MWHSAGAEEQEVGPGLEAKTRIVKVLFTAKILRHFYDESHNKRIKNAYPYHTIPKYVK